MQTTANLLAPHSLETVHREMSGEFTPMVAFLSRKLAEKMGRSAREYAELREAKALISVMKYSGFTDMVRSDEMAWALHYARDAYAREADLGCVMFIEKAAKMLDIDLKTPAPMPSDLARRITNELILLKAETLPLSQAG